MFSRLDTVCVAAGYLFIQYLTFDLCAVPQVVEAVLSKESRGGITDKVQTENVKFTPHKVDISIC